MPQNKAARFNLSKVPQELRKPALEHLLAYRTFKDKMVNDFRPKESTFRDGTVTIKHVVDEDLQKALHQNQCELRLQFHQKDLDAAQDKHKATHKAFNEAMKSYYDAYTSLSTDYKVDLNEVDTQDALMDLGDGNNFYPIVDVMMTTARQHVQHTVEAMVTARRRIDLEAEAKHALYLEHHIIHQSLDCMRVVHVLLTYIRVLLPFLAPSLLLPRLFARFLPDDVSFFRFPRGVLPRGALG